MTLSPRAIRALGSDFASMKAEHAGERTGHVGGMSVPSGLEAEVRELSGQCGFTPNRIAAIALWRLLRDLKAMDAAPAPAAAPAKPTDHRGEIARRLGADL